jgi:hypothetical protein
VTLRQPVAAGDPLGTLLDQLGNDISRPPQPGSSSTTSARFQRGAVMPWCTSRGSRKPGIGNRSSVRRTTLVVCR